jgi:hypothetical protein
VTGRVRRGETERAQRDRESAERQSECIEFRETERVKRASVSEE